MNCQWRVARRPDGNVRPEDFEYREEPIAAPGEGEFLRKTNSTMRVFFIYNHERDFDRGERQMLRWLREGKLTPAEHIFDGFDQLPEALASLYTGKNHGITFCRVRRGPNDTEGLH